jgi:hypothetical protein
MHILYTEGARNSSGPGFEVKFEEKSTNNHFYTSTTKIVISFVFNKFPVQVQLTRDPKNGERSPAILYIRSHPNFGRATAPPPPPALAAPPPPPVDAAAERERRLAIHDAMMDAERAEIKAKELRRKLNAVESRKAAAEAPPKPFTAYREPPRSKKAQKKAERAARRQDRESVVSNALEHDVHTLPEQRTLRENAFNLRQELEHAEKIARDACAKVAALKKHAADASAAFEAATHVVPARATLDNVINSAMGKVELL